MTNDIDNAWENFKNRENDRRGKHEMVAKFFRFRTTTDLYNKLREYIDTAHRDAYVKGVRSPEVADTADELYSLISRASKKDLANYRKIPIEWLLKIVLNKGKDK